MSNKYKKESGKSITLINPPTPHMISDQVQIPLGVLYLASDIRANGHHVNFVDMAGKNTEDFNARSLPKSDYYGIGFVTPQFPFAIEALRQIKAMDPYAKVLAGGVHATSLPRETLNLGFDAVVMGEGESAMRNIMDNGLMQKIYQTQFTKDLDSLEFPAWDLINMNTYLDDLGVVQYLSDNDPSVEREINMMTTRGCTASCSYCTSHKGPLRWRSKENIMDELHILRDDYGANRFFFVDDNIVVKKPWLKDLCSALKEEEVRWHCLGRADQVDYDLCSVMADSGCMGIDMGIESGSQRMLDLIGKRTTVEKQEEGIRAAYNAGLKVRAQFMVGLPTETDEDHRKNLEFISKNKEFVAKWGVHNFVPFPSSDIWKNPHKYDYEINHDIGFGDYQTIGKPGEWNYVPAEASEEVERRRRETLEAIGKANIFEGDNKNE